MRFNLGAAASELAQAAEAMGIARAGKSDESAAEEAIDRVYELIGQMNLPQHLSEVGVQEADLPGLARIALQSSAVRSNPRPITDAAQIEGVLRAAW
jgi:alcohol dehydrogenase class IV